MTSLQIETVVTVPACAAAVYRVLADYAGARRRLAPRRLVARSGVRAVGIGGGTHLDLVLHGPQGRLPLALVVTEPEAGTVLVESDPVAGVRRTFVLEAGCRGCRARSRTAHCWMHRGRTRSRSSAERHSFRSPRSAGAVAPPRRGRARSSGVTHSTIAGASRVSCRCPR